MTNAIRTVIVKLAGRCNLNCSYCYVYNREDSSYRRRPRFISDEIFEAMLLRMRALADEAPRRRLSLVFHGGEPTLVGSERFDRLVQRAVSVLGPRLRGMSIQTNATLLTEEWVEVLRRNRISVGISLDGPVAVHDAARVDFRGRGSYAKTMTGIALLRRGGIEPKILCVINPNHSGREVYRHFRSEGITWMSFLLPDVSHDTRDQYYPGLGPTPIADYLIPIFDEWFAEDDPQVVVATFWDLIQRLLGGPGTTDAFGNPAMTYVIVETDGAIEPLDALRVCGDGFTTTGLNIMTDGLRGIGDQRSLLSRAVTVGFPLPTACRPCRYSAVCAGGYLPHRFSNENAFDNPSVWCRDIQALIDHVRDAVEVDGVTRAG